MSPEFGVSIYVVRSATEVIYVGMSEDDCFTRLRTHLGHPFRWRPGVKSRLGKCIEQNLPISRAWIVELYSSEETKKIVPKEYWERFVLWPVSYAESAMIQVLKPRLNVVLTASYKK